MLSNLRYLAVLPLLLAGCGQVRLYSNLPEQEVNEMVAILQSSNIACSKIEGDEAKWHITVAEEAYADAVALLSEAGRPRKQRPTIEELFPKTGFTSSPTEQRIRLTYGLEQSLESTIAALPGGVLDARVHLVLPENQPLRDSAKPSRANVVVIHRKDSRIEGIVATIPQIVMGAVDGLDADSVSVELVPADDTVLADRARMAARPRQDFAEILTVKLAKESVPRFIAILSVTGVTTALVFLLLVLRVRKPQVAN